MGFMKKYKFDEAEKATDHHHHDDDDDGDDGGENWIVGRSGNEWKMKWWQFYGVFSSKSRAWSSDMFWVVVLANKTRSKDLMYTHPWPLKYAGWRRSDDSAWEFAIISSFSVLFSNLGKDNQDIHFQILSAGNLLPPPSRSGYSKSTPRTWCV